MLKCFIESWTLQRREIIFQTIFLPGTWVTVVGALYINPNPLSLRRDKELKSAISSQGHPIGLLGEKKWSPLRFVWNALLGDYFWERVHGGQAQENRHSCFLIEVFPIFLEKGSCLQTLSSEKHVWGSGWGRSPVQMGIFLMQPDLQEATVSRGAVRPPPSLFLCKSSHRRMPLCCVL